MSESKNIDDKIYDDGIELRRKIYDLLNEFWKEKNIIMDEKGCEYIFKINSYVISSLVGAMLGAMAMEVSVAKENEIK